MDYIWFKSADNHYKLCHGGRQTHSEVSVVLSDNSMTPYIYPTTIK